ncbi:MAG: gamma-glutamylcyclotransferase, partial [Bacteroidia bacterium]|nr:gamma-glutamylcyclotransferase [Bacteroidia bacterium]
HDDNFIIGELYEIKEKSEFPWAIGQLDDYEGVNVESDEMQLYRRELTDVYCNDQVTQAWIYWYNGDIGGKPFIAGGDLMQYLHEKK